MTRACLLALLLLLPFGCGVLTEPGAGADEIRGPNSSADVILATDRSLYGHGDTARIQLINKSDQPVGYNFCFSAREFSTGGEWRRIEPLRLCAAVLYTLAPGEEALHMEPITSEWVPGRYRMVTPIELVGESRRTEALSEPIDIVP